MNLYIFERIEQLTHNYHSEGGLVVIAENEFTVEEMIKADGAISITEEEWNQVKVYELLGDEKPAIFKFPDAGCC